MLELVPIENSQHGGRAEDYYLDVDGKRVGYLYRASDSTWTVGVMNELATATGDIGPFAQGLPSQADALAFARQHLPTRT